METLQKVDLYLTRWLERNVGMSDNKILSHLPYFIGLLPYELYAIPGMFLSIIIACYYQSYIPMVVHLIPQWAAFSVVSMLKNHIKRTRPGCLLKNKNKLKFFDKGHCDGSQRVKSFPSGHTIISTTLATSMCWFIYDPTISPDDKSVWGLLNFQDENTRFVVAALAIAIAVMVAVQRVSHGYHHVSDVCVGGFLGLMISTLVYVLCMRARGIMLSQPSSILQWNILSWIGIVLATAGLIHFFIYQFPHLTRIRHG